jgi:hypothetical protein
LYPRCREVDFSCGIQRTHPFLTGSLEKARKLLQAAIENEVMDYIQFHKDRRDENGQRLVVRNEHLPEREIISGIGPIKVRQPRVRHRDRGPAFGIHELRPLQF